MASLQRKRSTPDNHAAFSHERGFGDDVVSALRGRFDGRQSEILSVEVLDIISDYQITSFGSVATMLSMLLNTYPAGVPKGLKTDQLRFAMCGSAPVRRK
jgi:acyl-CoA synthetase (AMP-forming)/AMP-acid ligase II